MPHPSKGVPFAVFVVVPLKGEEQVRRSCSVFEVVAVPLVSFVEVEVDRAVEVAEDGQIRSFGHFAALHRVGPSVAFVVVVAASSQV